MTFRLAILGAVFAVTLGATGAAGIAKADTLPVYPNPGMVNNQDETFVAANTGFINVWFGGKGGAGDDDTVTAIINGVAEGTGLDNQSSTLGEYFNLGPVTKGDTVSFQMNDLSSGNTWSSDNSLNPDKDDHVYIASFAGGMVGSTLVPATVYFGFEDEPLIGSDLNYQDVQFYAVSGVVPEPATWAMMLAGFGGLGAMMRSRRRSAATTA